MINSFTWQMNLTVRNLHKNDFSSYICSSENALGKSDTRIRLQGKKKIKGETGKLIFPHFPLINLWHIFCCFLSQHYLILPCFKCENFSIATNSNAELHLPPKPTTTSIPYIYTTPKPRTRNKQQHQHKTQHESSKGSGSIKDAVGPNQIQTRENDAANEGT